MLDLSAGNVIASALPFMVMSAAPQTVNKTRVVEAVITAIIVGVIVAYAGMYVALPVIQERLDTLRRDSAETRQLIRDIKMELEARAIQRDLEMAKMKADLVSLQIEVARRR